jgi:hypothetical protein
MQKLIQILFTRNIRDETFGHVRYIYNNLPTNQGSTQKPHCIMWLQIYREQWKTGSYSWALLDTDGASYSTSCDITKAVEWHGIRGKTYQWIGCIMGGRKVTATPTGEKLEGLWPIAFCRRTLYYPIAMMPDCCQTQRWTQICLLYSWECAIIISWK